MNKYVFVRYMVFPADDDEEAREYLNDVLANDNYLQLEILDGSTWIMEEPIEIPD